MDSVCSARFSERHQHDLLLPGTLGHDVNTENNGSQECFSGSGEKGGHPLIGGSGV